MKTIGIFGDKYDASTGFAVVLRNLANELSRWFRVIYFGRFGQEKEFAPETTLPYDQFFEYVPCQGGVWDRELVIRILKHYPEIDYVFTEDDWFSLHGIVQACLFWDKPIHVLSPIDSLPIHKSAFSDVFTFVDKLYVPNSSYVKFNNKRRYNFRAADQVIDRQGNTLKSIYLPHGVDTDIFFPMKVKRDVDDFTFLWMGRVEKRKSPDLAIQAFEKVCDKMDAYMLFRTDWMTSRGQRLLRYIEKKNLPIVLDYTEDIPHHEINLTYNKGDINVCTAKAGGFEMGITESAACGLMSLVTDWTFMNENVVDGKSGFRIPVKDFTSPPKSHFPLSRNRIWGNISVDKLSEKMYWCYLNQELTRAMGKWARYNVATKYKWKDVAYIVKEEVLNEG